MCKLFLSWGRDYCSVKIALVGDPGEDGEDITNYVTSHKRTLKRIPKKTNSMKSL